MQIKVVCGDEECRREFPVSTEDPSWECPGCGRTIVNKRYPFLSARLMQGTIEGDEAEWKELYTFLLERARAEFEKRSTYIPSFIEEAELELSKNETVPNVRWREMHDLLLEKAREAILALEED
ncbi:MAG: hypothetical protein QCI82_08105 [Candidatus Thermoplasmatota archaeon]|nr:hypothetical protein [Candidatus Thermoplasmatota archaeon]